MVNVDQVNSVVADIKYLRENIYHTQKFLDTFSSKLTNQCASAVNFTPQEQGGWEVEVVVKPEYGQYLSEEFLKIVSDTLLDSLYSIIGTQANMFKDTYYMIYVVSSGNGSFIIIL